MAMEAADYPANHSMFLCALQEYHEPSMKAVIVSEDSFIPEEIIRSFPSHTVLRLQTPTDDYPLVSDMTTYYICAGTQCFPPVNNLSRVPDTVQM